MFFKNTRIGKNIVYFIVGIFCIVLFAATRQFIYSMELHNDEISWFFHVKFFEQAFIKHDLESPLWVSYESYDHPQLSKYIFGAYLWQRYPKIFTLRNTLEHTYGRWKFYFLPDVATIRNTIFAPYLYSMREVNHVFFVGLLVSIGITIYIVTLNVLLPVLGIILLLQNFLFVDSMIRATSDAQVMFFTYASLLLYILHTHKKSMAALIGSGLCAGLAVSAKLTGVLILYTLIINEVVSWALGYGKEYVLRTVGILVGLSMLVWIGTNPGLYSNPIFGSIHYFDFRIVQSSRLQSAFSDVALITVPSRIRAVYCTVFDSSCEGSFYHGALLPHPWLNLGAMVFGVLFLIERGKIKKYRDIVLSVSLYMVTVIFVVTCLLVLNSDRYFIAVQINVWTIELFGLYWIYTHGIAGFRALRAWITKTPRQRRGEF